MTKSEIEQAAKDLYKFDVDKLSIEMAFWTGQRTLAFIAGAEMVNEKQPYSAEDMKLFFLWLIKKIVEYDGKDFLLWGDEKTKTFDELLKLWEESKNG